MSAHKKRRVASLLLALAAFATAALALAGTASATGDQGQDGAPAEGTTIVGWVMPEGATPDSPVEQIYPQVWDQDSRAETCGRWKQIDTYRYDGEFKTRVDALTAGGILVNQGDLGLDEGLDIGLDKTWRFQKQDDCVTTPPAPIAVTYAYEATTPDCVDTNKVFMITAGEHVTFDVVFPLTLVAGESKEVHVTAEEGFVLQEGTPPSFTVANDFVLETCVPPTTVVVTTTPPAVVTTETAPPVTQTVETTLPPVTTTATAPPVTSFETSIQTETEITEVTTTERVAGPVVTVPYVRDVAQYQLPDQAATSGGSPIWTPTGLAALAVLLLALAGGVTYWHRNTGDKQASAPSHK